MSCEPPRPLLERSRAERLSSDIGARPLALSDPLPGTEASSEGGSRPDFHKTVAGSRWRGHSERLGAHREGMGVPGSLLKAPVESHSAQDRASTLPVTLRMNLHPVWTRGHFPNSAQRAGHRAPTVERSSPPCGALRGISRGSTFAKKRFRWVRPMRTRQGGES